MVSPYSAGTLTLQEAPRFAWRTNGLPLSRERRENQLTMSGNRYAPLVGLQRLVMRPGVLEILWTQPCSLGNSCEHLRADLFAIMKRK